jgi:hypothetical protein
VKIDKQCLIKLDVSGNDPTYENLLPGLLNQLIEIKK